MSGNLLLLILPIGTVISGLFVYRFQGKRQLLQLDIVQFIYTFFVAPAVFVWLKLLLFSLLRTDQSVVLSESQLFMFDTLFSMVFLFVYAFIVMHSLTKTFYLKKHFDPLYDLFHHSEYIHLWLSHQAMIIGGMFLFVVFSLLNIFFPLYVQIQRYQLYVLLLLGITMGIVTFVALIMADPLQTNGKFLRMIKLYSALFFTIHILFYIIFDPALSPQMIIYWFFATMSASLAFCSGLVHRSKRAMGLFERIRNLFLHKKWGWNIEL